MKETGHEFEHCFNDINAHRNTLKSFIESMPYKSEQAAPAFIAAMNDWDGQFDILQKGLLDMRDIMLPQAERVQLTEEDNINIANFFNPGGGQPAVVSGTVPPK
jgi:hypothetical protein